MATGRLNIWHVSFVLTNQLTNQDAEPGTIASSNPSDLPSKLIWSTSLPLKKVWGTIIIFEVSKLAEEYNFRYTLISSYEIARGEEGTEFDVISVGIDVSEPVVKADAEEFVKRCSEMLATHHLEDTIDQVSHSRFWGNLAPQRRR